MFLNCEFNFCLQRDHPDSPELTVHHCQYTAWPDHQVPKYPASLVRFVQTVRRAYRDEETPMVVHCRYMRTGTQCHVGGEGDLCYVYGASYCYIEVYNANYTLCCGVFLEVCA